MLLGAIAGAEMAIARRRHPGHAGHRRGRRAEHYRSTAARSRRGRSGAVPRRTAGPAPSVAPRRVGHEPPALQARAAAAPAQRLASRLAAGAVSESAEGAADYSFSTSRTPSRPLKGAGRQNVVAGLLEHDWKTRGKT